MFKRKHQYLMQIDGRLNLRLEELREQVPELASLPEDELRSVALESIEHEVMDSAQEALGRHGQQVIDRIETAGHVFLTGAEFMENEAGEHYGTFSAAFKGDQEGAVAATDLWFAHLQTFRSIENIGHMSLRGTDGTDVHHFDEALEKRFETLDPETLARIDELMDPDRP